MRRDFAGKELPFVQVQIGSHALYSQSEQSAKAWTAVREKQRQHCDKIPQLGMVTAADCPQATRSRAFAHNKSVILCFTV